MGIIKTKFFGLGAAGNKAMMMALESEVVKEDDVVLVNSTEDDIPNQYDGDVLILPGNTGGTGKNRKTSKAQADSLLKKGGSKFEMMLGTAKPKDDPERYGRVIMVCSADGGSGSGSTPVFAKHIVNDLHIPVTVFAFVGKPTDVTSRRNTIEFFTELGEIANLNYVIIDNSEFMLSKTDFDDSRIELDANKHFCMLLSIFNGNTIVPGNAQNMDKRDQETLTRTPGYIIITSHKFDSKVKNAQQVIDETRATMDDNLKGPDPSEAGFECLGVIVTASSSDEMKYLNAVESVIEEKFGGWFKKYNHRQEGAETVVDIIMTGVKPPSDWIGNLYDQYKALSGTIDRSRTTITGGKGNKFTLDDDSAFTDPFADDDF